MHCGVPSIWIHGWHTLWRSSVRVAGMRLRFFSDSKEHLFAARGTRQSRTQSRGYREHRKGAAMWKSFFFVFQGWVCRILGVARCSEARCLFFEVGCLVELNVVQWLDLFKLLKKFVFELTHCMGFLLRTFFPAAICCFQAAFVLPSGPIFAKFGQFWSKGPPGKISWKMTIST